MILSLHPSDVSPLHLCLTASLFVPPPFSRLAVCTNITTELYMRAYLTPCINDCGMYGQCKLLRTNNYLYAACECKAGEISSGFGANVFIYIYHYFTV